MTGTCAQNACTVDATGRCVLGNDADACPHRSIAISSRSDEDEGVERPDDEDLENDEDDEGDGDRAAKAVAAEVPTLSVDQSAPPLRPPVSSKHQLPVSRQLGLGDLRNIMRNRPVRLIGVLGVPDAGKTATLVSLYLLAANAKLSGFEFRNSDSLLAFDQLARGARQWAEDGGMLAQMTLHTELEDPRRPSFLHIRLKAEKLGVEVDLAFPDLPGEWTDSFIDQSDSDRLQFLRGAEAIWVMADGVALADHQTRQHATNRVQLLLSRIRKYIDPISTVPVILVVTRRDKYESLPERMLAKIKEEADRWSLKFEVVEVAPFSKAQDIKPGFGISELLCQSLSAYIEGDDPDDFAMLHDSPRQIMRYRRYP